jgi:hypothetical protein
VCGRRRRVPRRRRGAREIDCFYVYPTVSEQRSTNADKSKDEQQFAIARYQANHVMYFLPGDGNFSGENAARWQRIGRAVYDLPGHAPAMVHPQGMHWPYDEWRDVEWLAVQAYQGYGKGLIKQFKCSPDAYVQMIIQLAYFKMYGKNRPTYESAATRRFQLGRTETCRTVSSESTAWCASMADASVSDSTRVDLFRKAVAGHIEYISAASDGKGVDRHLFGLKKLLGPGEDVPALYKDPAYAYSSSWYLSTSQLSSEFFNGYGWSQVIDGGFGIAYMINENRYAGHTPLYCTTSCSTY